MYLWLTVLIDWQTSFHLIIRPPLWDVRAVPPLYRQGDWGSESYSQRKETSLNLHQSGSSREACSHFCAEPLLTSSALLHNEMKRKRRGSFAFLSFFPPGATDLVIAPCLPVVLPLSAGKRTDEALQSVLLVLAHSFPREARLALTTWLKGFWTDHTLLSIHGKPKVALHRQVC